MIDNQPTNRVSTTRRLRIVSTILVSLFVIGAARAESGKALRFDIIPATPRIHLPKRWDYFEEIEHKGPPELVQLNECAPQSSYLESFPTPDQRYMYYWEFVAHMQKGRKAKLSELGEIDSRRIVEILLTFEEPDNYVKILAFSPPNTRLICPFFLMSEWEAQVAYQPSQIIEEQGRRLVRTEYLDRMSHGHPDIVRVDVAVQDGLPRVVASEPLCKDRVE